MTTDLSFSVVQLIFFAKVMMSCGMIFFSFFSLSTFLKNVAADFLSAYREAGLKLPKLLVQESFMTMINVDEKGYLALV